MRFTRYAILTVLSMMGMGDVCGNVCGDVASLSPSRTSKNNAKTVQQPDCCSFGHKCYAPPHRRSNFWVSGDLLIWNVCEDGFSCEFGSTTIKTSIVNSKPTTAISESDKDIDFEWGLGFRVGAGVDWPCSGWDFAVYWTHYNGDGDGRDGHNHADWWLHFNVYDAVFGRKFWVGSCVDLRPFTGLRYAQIKQGLRTRLETDIIAATGSSVAFSSINDKQKLWALGPELGLEANFYFAHRWSIYGNIAGAALYGHTKTIFKDTDTFALTANLCNSSAESCANQMVLDFGLGIRWELRHFTLQGGLEQHTYFNYNHIGCCGNLNLFGANVSAAVHF